MLIIKKIPVAINFLNCKIKKHFSDVLQSHDINLTPEQYLVMDILWDEESLSQQTIADILQKDKNSVTKFIDSLEKKGLVYRSTDKNDRRINNIFVSEEGRRLKQKTTDVAVNTMESILNGISEDELATCITVMEKIKKNIE